MKVISILLDICEGNPLSKSAMQSFDVFFDVRQTVE